VNRRLDLPAAIASGDDSVAPVVGTMVSVVLAVLAALANAVPEGRAPQPA